MALVIVLNTPMARFYAHPLLRTDLLLPSSGDFCRKLEFLNSRKGASNDRKPGGNKFKFVKKKGLHPPKANSAEAEVEIEVDDDGTCFRDGVPCGTLDNDANFVAITEQPIVTETPLPVSDAGLVQ